MPDKPYAKLPLRGALKGTAEFIVVSMQAKSYKGITPEDLQSLLASRQPVAVIDCRDVASFALGHIPGAINIPFRVFADEYRPMPEGTPVVTVCYFGYYSRAAAQRVGRSGHPAATSLLGGMQAWMNRGYRLDSLDGQNT